MALHSLLELVLAQAVKLVSAVLGRLCVKAKANFSGLPRTPAAPPTVPPPALEGHRPAL